tara:strand:+ start:5802 stop:6113 length:312 start_codon:yes stop_codon:yes gene_type:complete
MITIKSDRFAWGKDEYMTNRFIDVGDYIGCDFSATENEVIRVMSTESSINVEFKYDSTHLTPSGEEYWWELDARSVVNWLVPTLGDKVILRFSTSVMTLNKVT